MLTMLTTIVKIEIDYHKKECYTSFCPPISSSSYNTLNLTPTISLPSLPPWLRNSNRPAWQSQPPCLNVLYTTAVKKDPRDHTWCQAGWIGISGRGFSGTVIRIVTHGDWDRLAALLAVFGRVTEIACVRCRAKHTDLGSYCFSVIKWLELYGYKYNF